MRYQKQFLGILIIPLLILSACSDSNLSEPEAEGRMVFLRSCSSCHSVSEGVAILGPSLYQIATIGENRVEGLSASEYIEESIYSPANYLLTGFEDLMPNTFSATLDSEELESLLTYLLTLE